MLPEDFNYYHSNFAYLLILAIPFLCSWLLLFAYQKKQTRAYASAPRIQHLFVIRVGWLANVKMSFHILSWVFATLALMRPIGNFHYDSLDSSKRNEGSPPKNMHDIILLIDTSGSMAVTDASLKHSRLEEAKLIAEGLISHLQGENVGLAAFTAGLTPLVPPTMDYLFTRLILKGVNINEGEIGGTNFTEVLEDLKDEYLEKAINKYYTVILLSDGGDNRIEKLQGAQRQEAIEKLLRPLSNASEMHLHLFTVGIGSAQGGDVPGVTAEGRPVRSRLERDLLEKMAQAGRGAYYEANKFSTWELIQTLLKTIRQEVSEEAKQADRVVILPASSPLRHQEYFQVPLALALISLLLALTLPDTLTEKVKYKGAK